MPTSKSSSEDSRRGGRHTFSFELTKEQARLAGLAVNMHSNAAISPRVDRGFWWILAAFAGGEAIDALSGRQASRLMFGIPVAFVIGVPVVLIMAVSHVRNLITGRGSYVIGTPTTAQLTDSGFAVEARGLSARGTWASLHAINETPEFLLLYFTSTRAVVLPKSAMPNAAIEEVRAIGEQKAAQVSRKFAHWGRRFPF